MNLTEAVDTIEEIIRREEEDGARRSREPAFDHNPGADIQAAAGVARLAVQAVPLLGSVQDYLGAVRAALIEARESFRGYHPDPASFGSGTFTEIIRRVDELLAKGDHPASAQSGRQRRSVIWRSLVWVGAIALLVVGLEALFLSPGKDERPTALQMDAAADLVRVASERLAQGALKAPMPELRLLLAAAAQNLTGTPETSAKLLAVQSPDLIRVLQAHTARVSALAFSPDGQWLVSGGADGQLLLWNVHKWTRSDAAVMDQGGGGASNAHANEVRRIRFTTLTTLSVDSGGRANAEYRIEVDRLMPGNPGTSVGGSSTPDAGAEASARFGVLRAVGRGDGKVEVRWGGGDLRALGLAFSGLSTRIVMAVLETKGDVISLVSPGSTDLETLGTFPESPTEASQTAALDPGDRFLAVGGTKGSVWLLNRATRAWSRVLGKGPRVQTLAFSHRGGLTIRLEGDDLGARHPLSVGVPVEVVPAHSQPCFESDSGSRICLAETECLLIERKDAKVIAADAPHYHFNPKVASLSAGLLVVASCEPHEGTDPQSCTQASLTLWTATPRPIDKLKRSLCDDGADFRTDQLGEIDISGPVPSRLAIAEGDDLVATATDDGGIEVWSVSTHLRRHSFNVQGPVQAITFLDPDNLLVLSGNPSAAAIWNIGLGNQAARACRVAGRDLSPDEWREYAGDKFPFLDTCGPAPVTNDKRRIEPSMGPLPPASPSARASSAPGQR